MSTRIPIKTIQYQLRGNNRHDIQTYDGKVDGDRGPGTNAGIKEMKRRLGYPKAFVDIRLDGDRDNKLHSYLVPRKSGSYERLPAAYIKRMRTRKPRPEETDKVARLLKECREEIGVRESGRNTGDRIRVYQSFCSLGGTGWPWCVAFLQAGHYWAGIPFPYRTAGAFEMLRWAQLVDWDEYTPRPGSCGVVRAGAGHINIVEEVDGPMVRCIDGNSNDMVRRTVRNRSEFAGYVRHRALDPRAMTMLANLNIPTETPAMELVTAEDGEAVWVQRISEDELDIQAFGAYKGEE